MRVTASVWITALLPQLTLLLLCVTCALRKKKQLSIKHLTQHIRKSWQYSVRRLIFVLLLRINKSGSVSKKVTTRRVLVNIVVEKSSMYYIFCVSTALFIHHAMRMRRFVLSCLSCLALPHLFHVTSRTARFSGKILNIKLVLVSCTSFCSAEFLIIRFQGDIIITVHTHSSKVPLRYSYQVLMKLKFFYRFSKNTPIETFMEIPPVGPRC